VSYSWSPRGFALVVIVSQIDFEQQNGPRERIRGARLISERLESASPEEIVAWAGATFGKRAALACSFGGPSAMVLLDMMAAAGAPFCVYYLDTGLLFEQTYELIERVRRRYGIDPVAVAPEYSVREQNALFGTALWSRDADTCCEIRKVRPQRRFLDGYRAWISGIRRDQSPERRQIGVVEWDERFGLVKVNPLAKWSAEMVWAYVRAHDVPYNPLHDSGYPSLGCTYCTAPVAPGEGERAGRWRGSAKTECGLHR
jgi:phosphoadenosine phosphosulfate reductase